MSDHDTCFADVFTNDRDHVNPDLAAELAKIAPAGLEYTFFSNSGTEAVEAALKFARIATGRSRIISTDGGCYGKTLGALAPTEREKYRTCVEPLMPGVELATDEACELTVGQMLKSGMCAGYIVNNPRVIRWEPPLTLSEAEVRTAVDILGRALTDVSQLLASSATQS